MKGQALVEILANHPALDTINEKENELLVCKVEIQLDPQIQWLIYKKISWGRGSNTSYEGTKTALNFNLDFECTNN